MTAQQIRADSEWSRNTAENSQWQMLREIAAQLAELNATLKTIADPTVGISTTLCASNDTIPVMIRER